MKTTTIRLITIVICFLNFNITTIKAQTTIYETSDNYLLFFPIPSGGEEVGDRIQLVGSARVLTSVTVGIELSVPIPTQVTMKIYGDGCITDGSNNAACGSGSSELITSLTQTVSTNGDQTFIFPEEVNFYPYNDEITITLQASTPFANWYLSDDIETGSIPSGETGSVGFVSRCGTSVSAVDNGCDINIISGAENNLDIKIEAMDDTTPPNAIANDVVLILDESGEAMISASDINNGSNDPQSGIVSVKVKVNDGAPSDTLNLDCLDLGSLINTDIYKLVVTNGVGLVSETIINATTVDELPPTAIPNTNYTLVLDPSSGSTLLDAAELDDGSYDNCDINLGNLTFSVTPNTFDCSNLGEQDVQFTVKDASDNTDTVTVTINVVPPSSDSTFCPLQIENVTPLADALQIAVDSNIELVFNHPIDGTTFDSENISVTGSVSGSISGTFSGTGTSTISFNPNSNFEDYEVITVTISTNLLSVYGSSLVSEESFEFTTFQTEFITTWETTTANESVTIEVVDIPENTYDYHVDWGDGIIEHNFTSDATHVYTSPETHTVKIWGDFPRIRVSNSQNNKIQSVEQWGEIVWSSFHGAFYNCFNLVVNATDAPNLNNVISLQGMFQDATSITGGLSNWDTSNIINMAYMFLGATGYNEDISGWDVSNVIYMNYMFSDATNFDQNLGNWDISSVVGMNNMFEGVTLSSENYDATLIGWSTDSTGSSDGVDEIPTNILFDGGNSQFCFADAEHQNLIDTYNWTITDGGASCDPSELFITTWQTTGLDESITMPTTDTGYNYNIDWGDGTIEFNITGDATHTYATAGTYTVKTSGMFPRIHFNNTGDKDKIQSIEHWGAIVWASFYRAFSGCSNLVINATDAPNLENVTDMTNVFGLCSSLETGGLSSWNTSTITNMSGMFNGTPFNENIGGWDVSNVTNMNSMFSQAHLFNKDLSSWDVSNVSQMGAMFLGATKFNQNLGDWDIGNIEGGILGLAFMFDNSALSTENYDAALIGWLTDSSSTPNDGIDDIPSNIILSGDALYCNSATERQELIDDFNWTIQDGGVNPFCEIDESELFITTWETTESNESITIPTTGTGYNYSVDWGDGTFEYNITGDATHTYATAGVYTVKIIGLFPHIYFENTAEKGKIQSVEQWGAIEWTSFNNAFAGCSNLVINATDAPNLENVTDMAYAFESCSSLTGGLPNWNTSTITNMSNMFSQATNFDGNIDDWDVSNVENMLNMFFDTLFTGDIGGWDVSNVENMSSMFNNTPFNEDIGNWNVSNVEDMTGMFIQAQLFNKDISDWDVSKVKKMDVMFLGTTTFNQNLGDWDIGNIEAGINGMSLMFTDTAMSTENYDATLIGWATDSSGTLNDGIDDIPSNIILSGDAFYCNSATERQDLIDNFNWSITDGGVDPFCIANESEFFITTWQTTGLDESITIPTTGTGYNYSVDWGDNTFEYNITSDATHTYATAGVYTVKIIGLFPRIYFNNTGDKDKIQSVEHWGAMAWTSMQSAFYGCSNLKINATEAPDLGNVASLEEAFRKCTKLVTGNFSFWETETVTNMKGCFEEASLFNEDINGWNVSNVDNMVNMFAGATSFNQSLSNWDISDVNSMQDMFTGVTLSTENYDATLIGWNIDSSGEEQDGEDDIPTGITFNGGNSFYCNSATERQDLIDTFNWTIQDGGVNPFCMIDESELFITTWETTESNESITIPTTGTGYNYSVDWGDGTFEYNITGDATHTYATAGVYTVKIIGMFPRIFFSWDGDSNKILTIEQWGTYPWSSMERAFAGCDNLNISNPLIDSPNLTQVLSLNSMFADSDIFNGNISNWNVSNITDMYSMFAGCFSFNRDLSAWDVGNVTNMSSLFLDTPFDRDISNWDVSEVTNMSWMFYGATNFDQNIGGWDITKVTNMNSMFKEVTLSTANYDATLIGWHTDTSSIPNDGTDDIPTNIVFGGGDSFYCNSAIERQTLIDTYNWTIEDSGVNPLCIIDNLELFITTWQTTELDEPITIPTTDTGYNYNVDWGDGTIESNITGDATHIYATAGVYTVKILGLFPRIYFDDNGDKDKIQSVEQWGAIEWSSFNSAFRGCSNLVINATDAPNLENVTDMSGVFDNCSSLTTGGFSSWNTSTITDMSKMFNRATNFNGNIGGWDVSNVETMYYMFRSAKLFNQNIGAWNVSNVTTMGSIFAGAIIFNQDISSWNVGNVEVMINMFENAVDFDQDISSWNVSNVEDMRYMFLGASDFDQDLSNWDISSVGVMESMFLNAAFSTTNYDNTLIGWHTDSSGIDDDGIDDVPTDIVFHGGNSFYCTSETQRQDLIDTYNWTIEDGGLNCSSDIAIRPKVYLQGAYINPNTGEESLMRDDLREAGFISTTSPYADLITAATTIFTAGGTLGAGDISDDIVDWVWVELRNAADNTVVVEGKSALLQRDGDVVDIDGVSALRFTETAGDYYIAIAHRSHLGIITTNTVSLSNRTTVLDLTTDSSLINGGITSVVTVNGVLSLISGDYDGNGQVQNTDLSLVTILLGTSDYSDADSDMNGQVQNTDINTLITPNIGNGEQSRSTIPQLTIIAPLSAQHKAKKQ